MSFVVMQRCPDCAGTFKDVSNHRICHSRGSGKHAHKPSVVLKQVCLDCRRAFVNLENHNRCRGRGAGNRRTSYPPVAVPRFADSTPRPPSDSGHGQTHHQDTPPPTTPPVQSLTPPPTPPSSNTERRTPAQQDEPDINAVPTGSQRLVREHLSRCMESGASGISVNRANILSSSMAFFKDVRISNRAKQLMVTFTDANGRLELGVDTGGPRREYLRLLLESIVADSKMLRGDENLGFLIRPNISAYLKRHFRVMGVMLATIIAQGGQPPAIFAPPVVDAILDKDKMPSVDYVPDTRKRESLKKVSEARDKAELQEALDECDWRFDLDGIPSYVSMDSRDEFLRECVQYFVILQSKPMLDQLIQGLRHCGILDLIRRHTLRDLLEYKSDVEVTAERVMDLLKPNKRCHSDEQQILVNLSGFLQAAEGGSLCGVLRESQRLTRSQTKFARRLTPGRLLAFVTGCSREPAGGFVPKPSIVFNRAAWRLPSAATCSNQILITVHQNSLEFHRFCQAMMTSMMNGENFTTA
ncbi:G2/M phase-specific E3 ubiquitin-protein ligase-like [Haliotis rubra]|uniref:G2/M phase-specific E3 ubiquitin-protein ligase-like n=1 Tax=Haliotis rubra TaxID=36100 RepID=UPI001EE55BFB|nr:G2/M phase-specific E3 ubiquitin-protein ligase-like [Haliotis rubra]